MQTSVKRRLPIAVCSQVLVMWWSLDVLDILLLWQFNSKVRQLLLRDGLLTEASLSGSLPVPGETSNVLESGHLLVSQVGEDLEHVATVSVAAEDIVVDQLGLEEALLEHE